MTETLTKPGHIIYPFAEVGEKSLALCGKKIRVEFEGSDIPVDHYTCRGCVDTAITLLVEADQIITTAHKAARLTNLVLSEVSESTDGSLLFRVIEESDAYQEKQIVKAQAKADRLAAEAEERLVVAEKKAKKAKKKGK